MAALQHDKYIKTKLTILPVCFFYRSLQTTLSFALCGLRDQTRGTSKRAAAGAAGERAAFVVVRQRTKRIAAPRTFIGARTVIEQ